VSDEENSSIPAVLSEKIRVPRVLFDVPSKVFPADAGKCLRNACAFPEAPRPAWQT
jgi:hypothetical protein